MSSAPDPHGHDAPGVHAFTGEPVQVLPPDEPCTPGWVPLLGIAFFTGAAIVFLAGHGNATTPAPDAAGTNVAVTAAAPPPQPAQAAPAPPARGGANPRSPGPAQSAAPGRNIGPDQRDAMRKNLAQAKAKGLLPDAKKPPAPR